MEERRQERRYVKAGKNCHTVTGGKKGICGQRDGSRGGTRRTEHAHEAPILVDAKANIGSG